MEETAAHICLQCVFAQQLWVLIHAWTDGLVAVPNADRTLESWWNDFVCAAAKEDRRKVATLMIYTTWNLWKERNRSVFDRALLPPLTILSLIKEEVKPRALACGQELLPLAVI
jgi:hypothetical protein